MSDEEMDMDEEDEEKTEWEDDGEWDKTDHDDDECIRHEMSDCMDIISNHVNGLEYCFYEEIVDVCNSEQISCHVNVTVHGQDVEGTCDEMLAMLDIDPEDLEDKDAEDEADIEAEDEADKEDFDMEDWDEEDFDKEDFDMEDFDEEDWENWDEEDWENWDENEEEVAKTTRNSAWGHSPRGRRHH